ncbi:hypothetical protein LTR99_008933 [Exophiala xenobiotica]|nr:hypothetical protein H2202_010698 [Exophiala xenobiotica]KAK5188774.1 hypothetical protein LTR92_011226 [Exophiala xenobiotica]KAK5296566.1 hypothetical protein LTR99_008933 [Exophiala xenobiotica]
MAPWSEAEGRGPVGSAPPDYETIGREHLRGGAAAPDLATVKDFLRFYRATSQPRLDPDRSTADSIIIVAEWFFAGFTRVKGTPTDEEERWARRTLTLEGIVVNKHRPKHNFMQRDVTPLHLTLWTCNDLIFIPERYRVHWTFILHVCCWAGARIAAFFTNGLRHKDVELVLQRVDGRRWILNYKVNQRWVKNNRGPENVVASTPVHHGP